MQDRDGPAVFDLKNLTSAIASSEEKLRVYERRSRQKMQDDLKAFAFMETTDFALTELATHINPVILGFT